MYSQEFQTHLGLVSLVYSVTKDTYVTITAGSIVFAAMHASLCRGRASEEHGHMEAVLCAGSRPSRIPMQVGRARER